MSKYVIEIWNGHHYQEIWRGDERYAETMFNKSYNARHTRRLIRITTEIIRKEKAGKYSHE